MRRSRTSLLLFLLGAPLWMGVPIVEHAAAQVSAVAPRARAPSDVMSFRGADWLERPERSTEEMPTQVLRVMGLTPGDVVADIGAGSGYFTRRMAPLVAPGGSVYAVDVQQEMLDILTERAEADGLTGIVPVLGEPADPKLPPATVDWMLLVDVYHELEDPRAMLAAMREALAPGGRVALLEYRVEDGSGDHIRAGHRMSVRQAVSEWEASGFRLVELQEFLPSQHLFVFGSDDEPATDGIAHYDLAGAVSEGTVDIETTARGDDAVNVTIRRARPEAMVVTLPAGARFEASDGSDMIARRDAFLLLEEDGPRALRVEAWRASAEVQAPPPGARLAVLAEPAGGRLEDLMWALQGLDLHPSIAPIVEQIAVWIAADDAGWAALSSHARAGSVHAANAVTLAAVYANASGLDIRQTRIWAEREEFATQITDQGLQRAFAELEGN